MTSAIVVATALVSVSVASPMVYRTRAMEACRYAMYPASIANVVRCAKTMRHDPAWIREMLRRRDAVKSSRR